MKEHQVPFRDECALDVLVPTIAPKFVAPSLSREIAATNIQNRVLDLHLTGKQPPDFAFGQSCQCGSWEAGKYTTSLVVALLS